MTRIHLLCPLSYRGIRWWPDLQQDLSASNGRYLFLASTILCVQQDSNLQDPKGREGYSLLVSPITTYTHETIHA